jgi:hypothetical protein
MSKYKPVRKKAKAPAGPAAGMPCIVLVIAGFVLVMLFMYFVMKYSFA